MKVTFVPFFSDFLVFALVFSQEKGKKKKEKKMRGGRGDVPVEVKLDEKQKQKRGSSKCQTGPRGRSSLFCTEEFQGRGDDVGLDGFAWVKRVRTLQLCSLGAGAYGSECCKQRGPCEAWDWQRQSTINWLETKEKKKEKM